MIRFGIAGFGLHAVKRMMPGFRGARNVSVSALSRRDIGKAREAAVEYGVPLAFDSTEKLCESPEVDAVFIATPNLCHLSDVLTAAGHGKHILCEKPLAMNANECREMIAAAEQAGVKFGVAQVFRFEDSIRYFRERVACGDLGEIAYVTSQFCYPGRNSARKWINDRATGGGTIADVGVHCVDALRFILRDEVESVQAQTARDGDSGDVDASGTMALRFSRGTLGTVTVSMRANYRTPMEIVGETGVLTAPHACTVDFPVKVELTRGTDVTERREFDNSGAYSKMLDAFADWVEKGTEFAAPGEEGLRNQVILDAAYESAKNGKSIALAGRAVG